MLVQTHQLSIKLQHDCLSCSGAGQFNRSSDLFTADMFLIPLLGQLEGTEHRRSPILHTQDPERVLLGSLWESGEHRLILLHIIGWPISEQGRAYVPRKLALGFACEHTGAIKSCKIVLHVVFGS